MGRPEFGLKYWILNWVMVASFGILFVAIFRLMGIKSKYYQSLARDNKIKEISIPASRGKIIDRKGRVMAKSVYQHFKLDEKGEKVFDGEGDYEGGKFEGKDSSFELRRTYPYKESASFVTGYIGKVSIEDIKSDNCKQKKLTANDLIGRGGVEETMECDLRGGEGRRLIEVDARGSYVRELGREEPEMGKDIALSIDGYWQEKIYDLIKDKRAVVIISEPSSGKVLNLVSSSAFDPNVFSYEKDNSVIKGYLDDKENLPLLNRAVSGRYHPGSVFKIVMASAGLEEGAFNKNTLVEDTGILKVGDYSYANWLWTKRGGTDGMVDMVKALRRSNDIYFYKLGEALGVDNIKKWAIKYGYGQKTGIELTGELPGVVPDDKWKQETKGERWYLGNTYHLSIGQGDLSVTPLQVNQMTNVIANNGVKCEMSIIKDKESKCEDLKIKKETREVVIEGMKEACKTGGTAWPLFNFKTPIACKTGTAEVGDGSKDTHAWLTAFAPADDPQISITVMVERGGEGSDVAAPIVGDILKEWFGEADTLVPRYQPTVTPKN